MSKYFLACATPTVELPVTVTDPAGKQATIKVGFKRYELDEATDKFEEITAANKPLDDLNALVDEGVEVERSLFKTAGKEVRESMDNILLNEIVYFKDVQLYEQVEGKAGEYKKGLLIADSRTHKSEADFGGKSSLDFLLEMSLANSIWRTALVSAMVSAISNTKLGKEAEAKN